jgi:proton glutamate symport protein
MNAISFLFEQLNFPKNAMPLFVHSSVFTNTFQALMSASAILTLTLLINHTYMLGERGLQLNWRRIGLRVAAALGCALVVIAVMKPFMHPADYYPHLYQNLRLADIMEPVPAVVYKEQPWDHLRENPDQQILEILRTRVLKVGYHGLEAPYCYWNKAGELVGYDVAYAHQLARDLDCTLEFVPLVFGHLKEEINAGLYDIAMSAIIMSEKRIINMSFTAPYDEQNFVLIVPLKESKQYTHLSSLAERRGLKIGGTGVFLDVIRHHFPYADPIDLTEDEQMAQLQEGKLDAIVWERASAFIWSLTHPDFIAIDYSGLIGRGYLSYGFHTNSPKFANFLNNWLILKQFSGFNEKMRNYWFDGVKR